MRSFRSERHVFRGALRPNVVSTSRHPATGGSLACDGRRRERERPSSRFDLDPDLRPADVNGMGRYQTRTRTPKLAHRRRASGMDEIAEGMAAVVRSGGSARRSFR